MKLSCVISISGSWRRQQTVRVYVVRVRVRVHVSARARACVRACLRSRVRARVCVYMLVGYCV